jgi:acetoin:2,6-dichlorophenolindophenol oxidoreductase subunit beta
VTQAAKWRSMFGGQASAPLTVRGIINRGGEQGAQHSQALHSWFAHIPGLRVVMPSTAADARDLLIAAVLDDDPVLYIDDRWLYDLEEELEPVAPIRLDSVKPRTQRYGDDATLVGAGFAARLCRHAAEELSRDGVGVTVIDPRVLNPLDPEPIIESVRITGKLIVVDGDWRRCGFASEIIASVVESLPVGSLARSPIRITLPDAPAPTSGPLERAYYPTAQTVLERVRAMVS